MTILTDREAECLALAADGLRIEAIARRLAISRHTVRNYLHLARLKLGARNTAHAAAVAYIRKEII